jgi:hypothetical protein
LSVTTTEFGFEWDHVRVQRTATTEKGHKVLTVDGGKKAQVEIYVSKSGSSVRVFRDGVELKAPQPEPLPVVEPEPKAKPEPVAERVRKAKKASA